MITLKKAIEVLENWRVHAYHDDDGTDEDAHELFFALNVAIPLLQKATLKNPATNADRIRAMSDEELATALETALFCPYKGTDEWCGLKNEYCNACLLDWLQQPVEEVDHV